MARGRSKKTGILDDLFGLLVSVPFWVGPLIALGVYAGLRWLVPWAITPADSDDVAKTLFATLSGLALPVAPWVGGIVLLIWLFAEAHKWSNRARLDRQFGIESIRSLNWQDFERLLAEAFRRQGYAVGHIGGTRPDGGVDLRLKRGNEVVLVQCKHWQTWKVDVKIIRELYGVVASESATAGIIVASGAFTADAREFACRVPITLIGGNELVRIIADVQRSQSIHQHEPLPAATPPTCPKCGAEMKLRTAKQGWNAGSHFWGCSRYPVCRGTRSQLSE